MKKNSVRQDNITNSAVAASAVATIAAALLVGCGGNGSMNSDPTQDFDVGPVVPPHSEKARTQKVLERSYVIEAEKDPTFIEGETASFKIRARLFFPVDSFNLKLSGLPEDVAAVSFVRSTSEAGTWIFTWSAPKGFIVSDRMERDVRFKIELADVQSSNPAVESIFQSVDRMQEFSFSVRRTGKTPQIVRANIAPEIAQGESVSFSVEVLDPASYDGYAPRVDIYFQGTNKTETGYEANGATYVRNESLPKHLGGGLWRFDYLFDVKNNDVGAQLDRNGKKVDGATHLQARFLIKAYGASGGVSAEKPQTIKIRYAKPQGTGEAKVKECAAVPVDKAAVQPKPKPKSNAGKVKPTGKGRNT